MLFYIYFVTVFCYLVAGKNEEYKGYKVYNLHLDTKYQQDNIGLLNTDLIDFWRKPSYKYGVVGKVMVPPSHFNWFEEKLEELGIDRDVYIEDVYDFLTKDGIRSSGSSESDNEDNDGSADNDDGSDDSDDNGDGSGDNDDDDDGSGDNEDDDSPFDINRYHRYDDILTYLHTLQENTDSTSKVELVEYGVTDQNRSLVYLKVSSNTNTAVEKPIVVIEAGINPRDWITIPAALNIVEQILDEQRFLEDLEWIVIPVMNPDGYEYTHDNLRLWEKSRSTTSHLGHICPGVNLNRNFDIDWLHFESSSSPCSHLYGGFEPFSEKETQMIRNIIQNNGPRIKLYISLQNNGGYISYPWNYERAASGMFRQHHLLGLDMVKAMNEAYNLDVGSIIFDRASGTSSDYVRENGVLYTFKIDVVQKGNGVVIPEEDIGNIVEDVWRAVAVAADEMIKLNV